MTIENLNTAIIESERFLVRARKLQEDIEKNKYWYGGAESAAVRRSSMDATKALADLRRREQ